MQKTRLYGKFLRHLWSCFFFFFQAEDGIRDGHVTGVQTCALPISGQPWSEPRTTVDQCGRPGGLAPARSEERRVGRECWCRWSTDREDNGHAGYLGEDADNAN